MTAGTELAFWPPALWSAGSGLTPLGHNETVVLGCYGCRWKVAGAIGSVEGLPDTSNQGGPLIRRALPCVSSLSIAVRSAVIAGLEPRVPCLSEPAALISGIQRTLGQCRGEVRCWYGQVAPQLVTFAVLVLINPTYALIHAGTLLLMHFGIVDFARRPGPYPR